MNHKCRSCAMNAKAGLMLGRRWRCCASDGGRSSGIALQGEVPNHRRLRRLSVGRGERYGKGAAMIASGVGQEGERKRTVDEVS